MCLSTASPPSACARSPSPRRMASSVRMARCARAHRPRKKLSALLIPVSKRAEMTDEEVQCVGKAAARFVYRCPDHLGDEVWGKYKVRRSTKP